MFGSCVRIATSAGLLLAALPSLPAHAGGTTAAGLVRQHYGMALLVPLRPAASPHGLSPGHLIARARDSDGALVLDGAGICPSPAVDHRPGQRSGELSFAVHGGAAAAGDVAALLGLDPTASALIEDVRFTFENVRLKVLPTNVLLERARSAAGATVDECQSASRVVRSVASGDVTITLGPVAAANAWPAVLERAAAGLARGGAAVAILGPGTFKLSGVQFAVSVGPR